MLVQVLLLLRSSTHTHTHTRHCRAILFLFWKELTRNVRSHVSVFPEFVVHEAVGQEVEDHGSLDQEWVLVV